MVRQASSKKMWPLVVFVLSIFVLIACGSEAPPSISPSPSPDRAEVTQELTTLSGRTPAPNASPTSSDAPIGDEPATEASKGTAATSRPTREPRRLMDLARTAFPDNSSIIELMGRSGDASYIPVLIEFLRFPWHLMPESLETLPQAMSDLTEGRYEDAPKDIFAWDLWVEWLGHHPEVEPPAGYVEWKGDLLADLTDPAIGEFFYDSVKTRIRVEEIVWGGVSKDGIPDLQDTKVVAAEEAQWLEPEARVFGISINGVNRAYPLQILNAHEMANDVVGRVPISLAY